MQRCDCTVRLAGDLRHTVEKKHVTVGEIAVLRRIHGNDGVVNLRRYPGRDNTAHAEEMARLRRIYGDKVIDELFPGHAPKLPVSLADIGENDKAIITIQAATATATKRAAAERAQRVAALNGEDAPEVYEAGDIEDEPEAETVAA